MPPECDVVIPVEDVRLQDDQIVVSHPVATGKHVGLPGEDVASGTLVLAAGRGFIVPFANEVEGMKSVRDAISMLPPAGSGSGRSCSRQL